jgi:hypothetical protein
MSTPTIALRARLLELDRVHLVRLPPLVREPLPNRTIWVSEEVYYEVQPPFGESIAEERRAFFRDALDAFTNHFRFTVGQDPFDKASGAMLARVHPVEGEFWDIRTIEPPDGIRCFGAFAGCDEFVALTWDYRENIRDFNAAVLECRGVWSNLFGSIVPYSGDSLDAYLTNYRPV